MSFSLQYAGDAVWYGTFSLLAQAGICHGISTRFGGSSQAPYASMNLAPTRPTALLASVRQSELAAMR